MLCLPVSYLSFPSTQSCFLHSPTGPDVEGMSRYTFSAHIFISAARSLGNPDGTLSGSRQAHIYTKNLSAVPPSSLGITERLCQFRLCLRLKTAWQEVLTGFHDTLKSVPTLLTGDSHPQIWPWWSLAGSPSAALSGLQDNILVRESLHDLPSTHLLPH